MKFYTVFLTALFVAMVLVAGLMRLAHKFNFVDIPDARKVHVGVIPRVGGIGMVLGAFAAVWLWMDVTPTVRVFLGAITVIAGFGLWDDRADLDYRWKFFGQFVAVGIVVFGGDVMIHSLSFFGCDPLPDWLAATLTVFYLLGMTNAMNLADGLDGLASGVSLLSLVCVMALAALADSTELLLMCLAIVGGTMGFLRYNTHPAQVFMGDTGSQFLGFSLGVLTIWLTQKSNTALAAELPLLIVGLPVVDTLTVMTQRVARKQSPFVADRKHFHHKLLDLGFDHHEAVLAIYAVQTLFVVSAYFMRYESGFAVLGLYAIYFSMLVLFYPLATRFAWRMRTADANRLSLLTRGIENIRHQRWLEKMSYWIVSVMIVGLFVGGSTILRELSMDTGFLALTIIIIGVVFRAFHLPYSNMVQRLTIYTCAILITHSLNVHPLDFGFDFRQVFKFYFITMAIVIAIGVYNSSSESFKLTPSDFLVMIILLMSAYLPVVRHSHLDYVVLQSVILLYAVEFVLRRNGQCPQLVWASSLAGLLVVGARAVL